MNQSQRPLRTEMYTDVNQTTNHRGHYVTKCTHMLIKQPITEAITYRNVYRC